MPERTTFHGVHLQLGTSRVTGRLIFGLVIVTLGTLFMLDNLGIVDSDEVLRFWPVALILFGLARLLGLAGPRNTVVGVIFTAIGSWMILHELEIVNVEPWDFWPVILILVGFSLVRGSLSRPRVPVEGAATGGDPSSTISAFALWSGTTRKIASGEFRGGDITAVMGGHEIDFRGAKLAGGKAIIELFVWWGGVDLRIPEDWIVINEGVVLMGGIEDQSKPPAGPPAGTLILRGLVIMGGVEIKN